MKFMASYIGPIDRDLLIRLEEPSGNNNSLIETDRRTYWFSYYHMSEKSPVHFHDSGDMIQLYDGYHLYPDNKTMAFFFPDENVTNPYLIKNLPAMNGSFRAICYDKRKCTAFIFGDRHSSRSLYYAMVHGGLLVSSSIFWMIKRFPQLKNISEDHLAQYFLSGQFFGSCTFFKTIQFLEPGTFLTHNKIKTQEKRYWRFQIPQRYNKDKHRVMDDLFSVFQTHIESVCRDRRIGFSLSGGWDSRLALLLDKGGRALAFTFGETRQYRENAEVKIARRISKFEKVPHQHIRIIPEDNLRGIDQLIHETEGFDTISAWHIPVFYDQVMHLPLDAVIEGTALDLTIGGSYLFYRKDLPLVQQAKFHKKWKLFAKDDLKALLSADFSNSLDHVIQQGLETIDEDDPMKKLDLFMFKNRVSRMTRMGSIPMHNRIMEVTPFLHAEVIDALYAFPIRWKRNHRFYRSFMQRAFTGRSLYISEISTLLPLLSPPWLHFMSKSMLYVLKRFNFQLVKMTRRKIWFSDIRNQLPLDYWVIRQKDVFHVYDEILRNKQSLLYQYLDYKFCNTLWDAFLRGRDMDINKINQIVTFELFLKCIHDS